MSRVTAILTPAQVEYLSGLIAEHTNDHADTDAMDRETSLALQDAIPQPDGRYRLFRVPSAAGGQAPRIVQAGELVDVTERFEIINRLGAKTDEGYAHVILDPVGLPIAAA